MNVKGDLSMNMIIVAAISLLVLAIIAYMVFGASDNVSQGTGCEGLGGKCGSECSGDHPIANHALDKSCNGQICCMGLGSKS